MIDTEYEERLLEAAIKLRQDKDRMMVLLNQSRGLWALSAGELVPHDARWCERRDELLCELSHRQAVV